MSYPNGHIMRKNRLIRMNQVSWKCEECGKKATEIHHKDLTKSNHVINNLKAVCNKCHRRIHARLYRKKRAGKLPMRCIRISLNAFNQLKIMKNKAKIPMIDVVDLLCKNYIKAKIRYKPAF